MHSLLLSGRPNATHPSCSSRSSSDGKIPNLCLAASLHSAHSTANPRLSQCAHLMTMQYVKEADRTQPIHPKSKATPDLTTQATDMHGHFVAAAAIAPHLDVVAVFVHEGCHLTANPLPPLVNVYLVPECRRTAKEVGIKKNHVSAATAGEL